ncbi:MAG: LytTR family DNA-binding domain-containing protein [Butyrivibrio sp.]|nr:LytTR family DNA-binding domain-containing protein [Butyrivibrio sp.]
MVTTVKIAICEDEIQAGQELKAIIEATGRKTVFYTDAESLIKDWESGVRYDVVFTDIVMESGRSGMDLCRRLSAEGKIFLVVVTNYIEYAPEGYRSGVFRYLLKPVKKEAVEQVFADMEKKSEKNEKFVVDAFDGERVISSGDILYVEVHGRYLDVYLRNGQEAGTVVMLMQSLKEFSAKLPKDKFSRINRNQLVNLERITVVKQGSLTLEGSVTLSVSRRCQKELQEALVRCLA